MLDLIGAQEFAKLLGTSQQNVTKSGKRAMNPKYRGSFLRPDAVFEGRPLWRRDRAEKYARLKKNTPTSQMARRGIFISAYENDS